MRPWNRYEPSRCGEVRRMQLLLLYVCGSLGKKANRGSGNSHVISLYKPGRKNVSSSRIWIVRVSQQNVSQAANCSRQLEQLGWTHVLRFRLAITKHFVRQRQDHLRSTDVPTCHSVSFVSYIPTYRYNGAVWQRISSEPPRTVHARSRAVKVDSNFDGGVSARRRGRWCCCEGDVRIAVNVLLAKTLSLRWSLASQLPFILAGAAVKPAGRGCVIGSTR